MRHIPVVMLLWALMGCASAMISLENVSSDSRVKHQIGREFILKEDVYLCTYTFVSSEFPLIDVPKSGMLGLSNPVLPGPVSTERIGFTDGKTKIVGVLPKGTTVKFDQVMHYSAAVTQYFYIILTTSDTRSPIVEYGLPAIGGLNGAIRKDFSQKPWFFDFYANEVAAAK